jgi:hypothetical protein
MTTIRFLLWGPAIATIVAALVIPGGLIVFALPLLGLGYLAFAAIASAPAADVRRRTR